MSDNFKLFRWKKSGLLKLFFILGLNLYKLIVIIKYFFNESMIMLFKYILR